MRRSTAPEACVAHGVLADGGEIVVVDNGAEPLAAELPDGVRLVREPVAGLSAGAEHRRRRRPQRRAGLPGRRRPPRAGLDREPARRLHRPAGRGRRRPDPGAVAGRAPRRLAARRGWSRSSACSPSATPIRTSPAGPRCTAPTGRSAATRSPPPAASTSASAPARAARSAARSSWRRPTCTGLGLGIGRYVAAAAVGHRIEPDRIDESYIAPARVPKRGSRRCG